MATALNVIAPYSPDFTANEYLAEEARLVRNAPSTWEIIIGGYTGLADLIGKINFLLTIDPEQPCLKTLEIYAHGSPINIDALWRTNAATWAQQLMTLRWCDEASIYLSGCNTGLPRTLRITNPTQVGPIAELLASLMPFDATVFPHKIWVYGTNGYMRGSHMEGNESTEDSFAEANFVFAWPPIEITQWQRYPGGSNSSGSACWNGFKNGNW